MLSSVIIWNEEKKCSDIINAIPEFLTNFQLNDDIGEFHLLSSMNLKIWENKEGMNWFYCSEIDPLNPEIRRMRIIAITHSYFLLLEPDQKNHQLGYPIFWATLSSIKSIQKSKNTEDLIVIEWSEILGQNFQVFQTCKTKMLINLISDNLNKLGSIVQNTYLLDIEEGIDRIKIYDILRKIERSERLLETFVDDEKVNGLIALYQKAVEYFSALNDSRYEIYLSKLQNLFTDQRVMRLICSEIKLLDKRRGRGRSMEIQIPREQNSGTKRKSVNFSLAYSSD